MAELLIYTREPIDNVLYDPRLAYSMHLGYRSKKGGYAPLNHHSGVLFAKATENADGSLNPMSLRTPYVFPMQGGEYGVAAVRILGDGGTDESSKGSVLIWRTPDFLSYEELGLLPLCDEEIEVVQVREAESGYELRYQTAGKLFAAKMANLSDFRDGRFTGSVEKLAGPAELFTKEAFPEEVPSCLTGMVFAQILTVSDEVMERLCKKLLTPENIGVTVPQAEVSSKEEMQAVKALLHYSDGTSVERSVRWKTEGIDFEKEQKLTVVGEVEQKHFAFPIALNRADPCMTYWEGSYYFIATNDADDNHTLYIRKADTIEGLADAKEHLILDSSTYEGIGGLLWAPEFHEINGRLYIFHAATPGEFFFEESHLMTLKEGGDPAKREDWSAPQKILKKDGTPLCEEGRVISLDMTCFPYEGEYYVIWSQREFLPKDLGAWLYIAKLNPEKPWELLTDPQILSKPDYGWGNNHTFVEEGPYALFRGNKLYITFSAAAVDTSYVVSYLEIELGKDLLTISNWRKNNYPILTSRSVEGEFGTGHNAYIDADGLVYNTYHARPGTEGVRSSGVRRVHFDIDGAPMLDVTEEKDIKPAYRKVTCEVKIRGKK